MGMLIPEKAVPELLAELQTPPEDSPEPQQDMSIDPGTGKSSGARKGLVSEILAGIRRV